MNKIITHRDLDGVVSAVLLAKKFKIKNIIYSTWLSESSKKPLIDKQTILSDLDFDPRCGMWFDHHLSNKINKRFKGSFKIEKSCARVIFNYFKGDFSDYYKKLVKETDKADSATFTFSEIQNPPPVYWLNFIGFIYPFKSQKQKHAFLHKLFKYFNSETSLDRIIGDRSIAKLIFNLKKFNQKSLELIEKNKIIKNNTLIVDLEDNVVDTIFLSSKYPKVKFILLIKKFHEKDKSILILIKNRFYKPVPSLNLGDLLKKYGGGGNKDMGGSRFNKKDKNKIINEIISKLY